jgi:hypothetical protein
MWTAGSVWIASFEGTRWRPYGDGTDVGMPVGVVGGQAEPGCGRRPFAFGTPDRAALAIRGESDTLPENTRAFPPAGPFAQGGRPFLFLMRVRCFFSNR